MFDTTGIALSILVPMLVIGGITVAIVLFVFRRVGNMSAPNRELLATGQDAQATILNLWDTGTTVNENPLVGMQLQVQPAFGPAYQVQTTHLISRLQVPQFQPGRVLNVKVDPSKPQKVAIAGRVPAVPR